MTLVARHARNLFTSASRYHRLAASFFIGLAVITTLTFSRIDSEPVTTEVAAAHVAGWPTWTATEAPATTITTPTEVRAFDAPAAGTQPQSPSRTLSQAPATNAPGSQPAAAQPAPTQPPASQTAQPQQPVIPVASQQGTAKLEQFSQPAAPAAPTSRSLLANNRLVTYYGLPGYPGMGVLGQMGPQDLLDSLKRRVEQVQALSDKPVLPAFELLTVQAQKEAQKDGLYRRRLSTALIHQYVDFAARNSFHILLDIQPGLSPIADEIEALRPWLSLPHVHLAIDAEFVMPAGTPPGGGRIGSIDASAINQATQILASIVQEKKLPNKLLMVHQFKSSMITHPEAIATNPLVDIAINVDGLGKQTEKADLYRKLMREHKSGVFAGMQIFLTHDSSPFNPQQAMSLRPMPDILVYY